MNKKEIIETLKKYNFDKSEYLILSSGSMVMHGIKNNAGDLDLAVSEKLLNELLQKYKCEENQYELAGKKVKFYKYADLDFSVNNFNRDNVVFIDNIPVQNINSLLEFKINLKNNLNREKDIKDIELIKNHLILANMNVLSLAYLGDAIYEVYIRKHLLSKGLVKVGDLQKEAINYVSAKAQSSFLEKMINKNFLTEDEITIVKRARNHRSHGSKTADIITYKRSTGLEALIGYLDLKDNKKRIDEILNFIVGD